MEHPRTRSGREKRKIDELTSENRELRARQRDLEAQSQAQDEEIAQLRAQLQQLQGGNGVVEAVEDDSDIAILSDGDNQSTNDTSNANNNSDEDGYRSTEAITGIDGERLDRGVEGAEESDEEEQDLINNINQNINGDDGDAEEAEVNSAAEQEDEIASDEEDGEETAEYQPPQAFEPDLKAYAQLSENDKACKADCPKLVLALLSVKEGDEACAQYCSKESPEGFGVNWHSFLKEKYEGYEVGKRDDDALSNLYVGVWRKRGSELPSRRNHAGLIWRDGSGRICIFDPFYESRHDAPSIIIDPRPRMLGTVDLMTGVYPHGTPMIEQDESEVVDLT